MAFHVKVVVDIVRTMHTHMHSKLTLQDLADRAAMSRFHFLRVFRLVTGAPPRRFLSMLRINEAKRLLATTDRSVTDICFEVGYESLGTFGTRFKQCVGMPPLTIRRLAKRHSGVHSILHRVAEAEGLPLRPAVRGYVDTGAWCTGAICIGLFPNAIPDCQPARCTILHGGGPYFLADIKDGSYYVLAMAVDEELQEESHLLGEARYVGRSGPIVIQDGHVSGDTDIALRPFRHTDPPILPVLPRLLGRPVGRD